MPCNTSCKIVGVIRIWSFPSIYEVNKSDGA
jgi:hypothetical protein